MNGKTNIASIKNIIHGALIPLDPPSLTLVPKDGKILLRWTDPADKYTNPGNELVSQWNHDIVVRKEGSSAVVSPTDGTIVVSSNIRDQYKTTAFVDDGLSNGTLYNYGIFSYTQYNTPSDPYTASELPRDAVISFYKDLPKIDEKITEVSGMEVGQYAIFALGRVCDAAIGTWAFSSNTIYYYNYDMTEGTIDISGTDINRVHINRGSGINVGSFGVMTDSNNVESITASINADLTVSNDLDPIAYTRTVNTEFNMEYSFASYAVFPPSFDYDDQFDNKQFDLYDADLTHTTAMSTLSSVGPGTICDDMLYIDIGGEFYRYSQDFTEEVLTPELRYFTHGGHGAVPGYIIGCAMGPYASVRAWAYSTDMTFTEISGIDSDVYESPWLLMFEDYAMLYSNTSTDTLTINADLTMRSLKYSNSNNSIRSITNSARCGNLLYLLGGNEYSTYGSNAVNVLIYD